MGVLLLALCDAPFAGCKHYGARSCYARTGAQKVNADLECHMSTMLSVQIVLPDQDDCRGAESEQQQRQTG